MIGFFRKILGGEDAPRGNLSLEKIGSSSVPTRIGTEIIHATAVRRARVESIKDHLSFVPRDAMGDLVDRVMARYALYVLDLPASERDHHCDAFGILDHSLEVCSLAVPKLSGSAFKISPDPLIDHQERPRWTYVAFLSALCHDIGKVLDIEVSLLGASRPWDPLSEPLGAYALRTGRSTTGRESWAHRPGRGLDGNQDRTAELMEIILTPEARMFLGSRLTSIDAIFRARTKESISLLPEPARRIKVIAGSLDRQTSKEDSIRRQEAAPPAAPPVTPETQESPSPPPAGSAPASTDPAAEPEHADLEPPPSYAQIRSTHAREWKELRTQEEEESVSLLAHELSPATFLDSIQKAITSARLRVNSPMGECYVTADLIWIAFPEGFKRLARFIRLSPNARIQRRMLRSLTESDAAHLSRPGEIRWRIMPHSKDFTITAVGLHRKGVLSDAELRRVGAWKKEVIAMEYPEEAHNRDTSKIAS